MAEQLRSIQRICVCNFNMSDGFTDIADIRKYLNENCHQINESNMLKLWKIMVQNVKLHNESKCVSYDCKKRMKTNPNVNTTEPVFRVVCDRHCIKIGGGKHTGHNFKSPDIEKLFGEIIHDHTQWKVDMIA
eukprot:UN32005